jgi:hypothetical protein
MSGLQYSLLGFCNPLLDISANVGDDFLQKYEVRFRCILRGSRSFEPYTNLNLRFHSVYRQLRDC